MEEDPLVDNSSVVGGVAASANTTGFCRAMVEERFKLATTANKADFVALATILEITLSPATYNSDQNRNTCIDEIADAILKRGVAADNAAANIPSSAEVKLMKAKLQNERTLATDMNPQPLPAARPRRAALPPPAVPAAGGAAALTVGDNETPEGCEVLVQREDFLPSN